MNGIKNIKNLFAVSLIVAMFALFSINSERQQTASYWADFLCPLKNIGCSTPSQKLNGSAARCEWRTEGKAAPLFVCGQRQELSVMSSTEKSCRRAKHSTPMATRTVNRLLTVLEYRASCPMAQATGLVGLRVVYGDNYRRLRVNSIEHYPVPECGYFTVCDVWLELDGRVMCRLETPYGKQKHIICMKWLTPYGVTDTDIRQAHYYPNTYEEY